MIIKNFPRKEFVINKLQELPYDLVEKSMLTSVQ